MLSNYSNVVLLCDSITDPPGTEEVPVKSVVNRVASQLHRAMSERGLAVLVNHGIPEEKVRKYFSP